MLLSPLMRVSRLKSSINGNENIAKTFLEANHTNGEFNMSQQIQELINKIKSDGINEAQVKAKHIEEEAHKKADQIINEAKAKANKVIADAKEETLKFQKAAEVSIAQAGRNSILSLRKEIEAMLKNIVLKQVRDSLTPQQTAAILESVIKQYVKENSSSAQITLSPADAQAIKDGLIAKLQNEFKKPLVFKTSSEMAKGFAISFDSGKSSFDFSDASLAEFLSAYVNDEVARILKTSAA